MKPRSNHKELSELATLPPHSIRGYGFVFEKLDLTHWAQGILHALRTEPDVYVPELVGAAILIWFVLALVRRRKVRTFIRNGQV